MRSLNKTRVLSGLFNPESTLSAASEGPAESCVAGDGRVADDSRAADESRVAVESHVVDHAAGEPVYRLWRMGDHAAAEAVLLLHMRQRHQRPARRERMRVHIRRPWGRKGLCAEDVRGKLSPGRDLVVRARNAGHGLDNTADRPVVVSHATAAAGGVAIL